MLALAPMLLAVTALDDSPAPEYVGDVTCSVGEYVRVGLEYEECQRITLGTLHEVTNDEEQKRLCQTIEKMLDVCSGSVKVRKSHTLSINKHLL